jgi:hypothetical protein
VDDRISIRAHYERFPATVKGAFVLRAADGQPHQVRIDAARASELAGGAPFEIDLQPVVLEVAPTLDLFVPFEVGLLDLGPGWYQLVCDLIVDAVPSQARPGVPFPIAWPRATVRRGTVGVGKAMMATGGKVRIEQVECAGDHATIAFLAEEPPTVKVIADDQPLATISTAFDEDTGRGTVTTYPVMKSQQRMRIEIKGAPGPIELKLPG